MDLGEKFLGGLPVEVDFGVGGGAEVFEVLGGAHGVVDHGGVGEVGVGAGLVGGVADASAEFAGDVLGVGEELAGFEEEGDEVGAVEGVEGLEADGGVVVG